MAKVNTKLQVTVPRAIADRYGIRPGDEIEWIPAGDAIRIVPSGHREVLRDVNQRLRWFDQATERQRRRLGRGAKRKSRKDRGWKREEFFQRGLPQ